MSKAKLCKFIVLVCVCLFCTMPVWADIQSSAPLTKDQYMHDLVKQGYQWSDLLSADLLARKYNVSLKALLDIKPAETSWKKVESALARMDLTRKTMQDQEKPGDTELPGKWNAAWEAFIKNNPRATSKEIYQFAGQLMDEFGLSSLDIVPYK